MPAREAFVLRFAVVVLVAVAAHAQDAPEPPPALGAGAAPADDAEAPEAVVTLQNGQRITGVLVERNDERIVLSVGNIPMSLAVSQIADVEVLPTIRERYESLRQTIGEKDLPQRARLVRWLIGQGRYAWALNEVEGILDQDPANPEAQSLRLLIVEQMSLHARSGRPRPEARPIPERAPKFQFPLLSADQINLLKVYEVDLASPPKMTVPREAVDLLLQTYAGNEMLPATPEGRQALYRRPASEVLDLMFRVRARDLYGMVRVQDQPRSMQRFRDNVHQTWLINSCATDRCHGGAEAGRLRLYNRRVGSDPTVYTNFLILDRFRTADGRPLIDYSDPARSPLLHLALPRELSQYPHPPVPGPGGRGDRWKPALESRDDRRFAQAVDWMRSMYQPRPDYPIEYTPPGTPPAEASNPAR